MKFRSPQTDYYVPNQGEYAQGHLAHDRHDGNSQHSPRSMLTSKCRNRSHRDFLEKDHESTEGPEAAIDDAHPPSAFLAKNRHSLADNAKLVKCMLVHLFDARLLSTKTALDSCVRMVMVCEKGVVFHVLLVARCVPGRPGPRERRGWRSAGAGVPPHSAPRGLTVVLAKEAA